MARDNEIAGRRPLPGPVVFVDGECLLCQSTVAFLVERDPDGILRFAHLQGELAAEWLSVEQRDVGPGGAVVLIEPDRGHRVSARSAAILRILGRLGRGWALLAPLASVPGVPAVMNVAYRFVARRRDAWFGRADECIVPPPALRKRFLESGDVG